MKTTGCGNNCTKCVDANNCVLCSTGFYLNDARCVGLCDVGSFVDEVSKQCRKCAP